MLAQSNDSTFSPHWLVLVSRDNHGGGAQVARQLVAVAGQNGQPASLLSLDWNQTRDEPSRGLWSNLSRSWRAIRTLATYYSPPKDLVVIAIGDTPAVHAIIARTFVRSCRVLVVAAQHQPRPFSDVIRHANSWPAFARRFMAWLIDRIHARADGYIFLTREQRAEFVRRHDLHAKPSAIIPNAIRFPVATRSHIEKRVRRVRDGSSVRILHVGRFAPRKNQRLAILSLAALADKELRLTLVGSGPQHECRALADALGLHERVTFLGSVQDMEPLYDEHDIILCTSLNESFGLTPFEGLVRGLPAIVPQQVPAFRDLASQFGTVLAFDAYEPSLVAEQISRAKQRFSEGVLDESKLLEVAHACSIRFGLSQFYEKHVTLVNSLLRPKMSASPKVPDIGVKAANRPSIDAD